jgi:hypothetical protein
MKQFLVLSTAAVVALFALPGCPERETVRVDRPVVVERRREVVREPVRVEERVEVRP